MELNGISQRANNENNFLMTELVDYKSNGDTKTNNALN